MSQDQSDESIEERRERLRAEAERKQKRNKAQEWNPAQGEMIEGEYLGSRVASTTYGEVEVYYVEEFETGDVYSILGRTSMKMEMDSEDPDPGALIMVTYEGKKNTDDSRGEFYSFDVVTA